MKIINFTGIKNAGGVVFETKDNGKKYDTRSLIVKLSDDKAGEDYSEYMSLLVQTYPQDWWNKVFMYDNRYVQLMAVKESGCDGPSTIYLNGKKLVPKIKTLHLITYIVKLANKVISMDNKDMIVEDEFKYNENLGGRYVTPNLVRLNEMFDRSTYKELIEDVYDPDNVKSLAQSIKEEIHEKMVDYFS